MKSVAGHVLGEETVRLERRHFAFPPKRDFIRLATSACEWTRPASASASPSSTAATKRAFSVSSSKAWGESKTPAGLPFWVTTTGAPVSETLRSQSAATSLQQRNATASVHPTSATTPAAAERESAARFRRAERETVKLTLQVVGDPTLRAKSVVEVRGISGLLSGKYYVTEAKHVVSSSGYVVDLKLTRDGTGQRRQAGAAAQGQPQGGQPNRAAPVAGGALTEVEVVDSESAAPMSSTGAMGKPWAPRTRKPA